MDDVKQEASFDVKPDTKGMSCFSEKFASCLEGRRAPGEDFMQENGQGRFCFRKIALEMPRRTNEEVGKEFGKAKINLNSELGRHDEGLIAGKVRGVERKNGFKALKHRHSMTVNESRLPGLYVSG